MDNEEKQIIINMLSIVKDFCEETQCRFCPFKADVNECEFAVKGGTLPTRLTKILERLEEC